MLMKYDKERFGESCTKFTQMCAHGHGKVDVVWSMLNLLDIKDISVPWTMKFNINTSKEVANLATVTETRCVSRR